MICAEQGLIVMNSTTKETKVRATGPVSAVRGLLVSFAKVVVVLVGAEQRRADTFCYKIE